jgi:KDO2-lipid IV(A) lauroyltransferase
MWSLGKMPVSIGVALSGPLGRLLYLAMKRRREIVQRNIDRCFSDWSAAQREALARHHFRSIARMLFETCWSWSMSDRRFGPLGQFEGMEHAGPAIAKGKGVLAITHHVTCLEIGARMSATALPRVKGIYRPLRNPVIEWYQNRARLRYSEGTISKRDMRAAIRFLRSGGVLWYAPDQDFGAKRSVFAPFFGIQTATLEATARLVEMTGCAVLPMFPVFDEKTRTYTVRILPALDDLPSGDVVRDLSRINAMMEDQVRRAPEQYWWIHRRFKTRPAGEPPFYD